MHPPEKVDMAKIRKALKPDNFQPCCCGYSSLEFDWISVMRNATIGFTDGLVVPFALNAGLAFAGDRRLLITAGSAELIAGSISMFCGAALSAWSDG